jgi:hypothetical protein
MARMTVSNEEIIKRIDGMERRMEGMGQSASDFRDLINRELSVIKTQIALGGQSQAIMDAKLDKISKDVDALTLANRTDAGASKVWEKLLDPLIKVAVAVMVAYLVYSLRLK